MKKSPSQKPKVIRATKANGLGGGTPAPEIPKAKPRPTESGRTIWTNPRPHGNNLYAQAAERMKRPASHGKTVGKGTVTARKTRKVSNKPVDP